LGIRGLNQKSKKKFCRLPHGPHGELTAQKWLGCIDKQKRRSNLKEHRDRQTDRQTEIQTDRVNDKK